LPDTVPYYARLGLVLGINSGADVPAFIGDGAFLRTTIPHHSRVILLCQEATLTDPEIVTLCES
jgi:hypothetical protein